MSQHNLHCHPPTTKDCHSLSPAPLLPSLSVVTLPTERKGEKKPCWPRGDRLPTLPPPRGDRLRQHPLTDYRERSTHTREVTSCTPPGGDRLHQAPHIPGGGRQHTHTIPAPLTTSSPKVRGSTHTKKVTSGILNPTSPPR